MHPTNPLTTMALMKCPYCHRRFSDLQHTRTHVNKHHAEPSQP